MKTDDVSRHGCTTLSLPPSSHNTGCDCPPAQPAPPPFHSQQEGNNYSRWIQRTSDNQPLAQGENARPERSSGRWIKRRRGVVIKNLRQEDQAELLFKWHTHTHTELWHYVSVKSIFNKCEQGHDTKVQAGVLQLVNLIIGKKTPTCKTKLGRHT